MTNPSVSATQSDAQPRTAKRRGKPSKKAARKAIRADATARVWALRRKGLTFRDIEAETEKQGERISRSTAADLYRAELKALAADTRADVEAYRAESIAKAEAVQRHLFAKVQKGDARAANAYARVQDQINKIRGVYAPLKVEVDDKRFKRLSDEELETEIRQAAAHLGFSLVPAG